MRQRQAGGNGNGCRWWYVVCRFRNAVINFFSLSTTRAHCALLPAALLCSALYGGCDFCELLVKLDALIVMPAGRFCIVFEVSSNSAIKSLVMAN